MGKRKNQNCFIPNRSDCVDIIFPRKAVLRKKNCLISCLEKRGAEVGGTRVQLNPLGQKRRGAKKL
ncbi:hypothetical protein H5410_000621 [Solanum commersonii]|uniref:Uncharacterized protein n=1 Tax=Solanum commersonii TaxID=4109 RepID=A0A9J6AWQ3_SOLCO|nr:hypothetical protein H5410_000621 [Solanum commersonii]